MKWVKGRYQFGILRQKATLPIGMIKALFKYCLGKGNEKSAARS